MISEVLILGAVVLMLMGLKGIKGNDIGKKLSSLCIASLGAVALSFAQMNVYGFIGGCMQLLFRFTALIILVILLFHVCKKNKIWKVDDIKGVGRKMPYIFMMITIFSLMIIGIPSTGTFMGIFYSELGFLAGEFGIFSKIGIFGNIIGVLIPAILIFPIWKNAYFPGKDATVKEEIEKPSKGIVAASVILMILLIVFSVFQKPIVGLFGKLIGAIAG